MNNYAIESRESNIIVIELYESLVRFNYYEHGLINAAS